MIANLQSLLTGYTLTMLMMWVNYDYITVQGNAPEIIRRALISGLAVAGLIIVFCWIYAKLGEKYLLTKPLTKTKE